MAAGPADVGNFDCPAVVACSCPEECLPFIKFFETFEIHAYSPGVPQGPSGTRGVRRNFANCPGVPQVSFGSLGTLVASASDPGVPQDPLGIHVRFVTPAFDPRVHQGTLGTSGVCTVYVLDPGKPLRAHGPSGCLKGLFQKCHTRRPHWLARGVCRDCLLVARNDCEHLAFKDETLEFIENKLLAKHLPTMSSSNGIGASCTAVCFCIDILKYNSLGDLGPRFRGPPRIPYRNVGALIEPQSISDHNGRAIDVFDFVIHYRNVGTLDCRLPDMPITTDSVIYYISVDTFSNDSLAVFVTTNSRIHCESISALRRRSLNVLLTTDSRIHYKNICTFSSHSFCIMATTDSPVIHLRNIKALNKRSLEMFVTTDSLNAVKFLSLEWNVIASMFDHNACLMLNCCRLTFSGAIRSCLKISTTFDNTDRLSDVVDSDDHSAENFSKSNGINV